MGRHRTTCARMGLVPTLVANITTMSSSRLSFVLVTLLLATLIIHGIHRSTQPPLSALDEHSIQAGDVFAEAMPATLVTLENTSPVKQSLSFRSAAPTILYNFTTACKFCQENIEALKRLEMATRKTHRVLAISVDDPETLRKHIRQHNISFPVYSITPGVQRAARLFGTPRTAIVSTSGHVSQVWLGKYNPRTWNSISNALGI